MKSRGNLKKTKEIERELKQQQEIKSLKSNNNINYNRQDHFNSIDRVNLAHFVRQKIKDKNNKTYFNIDN